MSDDRPPDGQPAQAPSDDAAPRHVDARGAEGVVVGEQNTQINYFYNRTWTDGVAAAPLVTTSGRIASPYRGLHAFEQRDAGLFFGRETAVAEVMDVMSRHLEGPGLVVVSGVSGAGKSSLLRAGVLPRFRGAGLRTAPEAASWPCVVFTPGRGPLAELAVRAAPLAGTDAFSVRQGLAADPSGFALTARVGALADIGGPAQGVGLRYEGGRRRVLLVVDQCEELFTRCETEQERRAFITALHSAATTGHGDQELPAALVVLVIRADFEARLADYPQLTQAVQSRYLLTAMTSREMRLAVTEPAVKAGSSVDSDLVAVLLDDVVTRAASQASATAGAGVLPLLSYALDQAWRARPDPAQALALADYVRVGGIEGALARSADHAYSLLPPRQQDAARQVFIRLTATSSDGIDTGARAARTDLTAGMNEEQARDVEAVLEKFAAERLLTLAAGTVEISHEVLLSAWPLLRDTWLADTHAERVVRTGLTIAAGDWDSARHDSSYHYAGSRLAAAEDVAARIDTDVRFTPLSPAEKDFLRASRHAVRRRIHRVQGFIAVLLVLVVGLAVTLVVAIRADRSALQASQAAARQRDIVLSGLLASESEASDDSNATDSQRESIAAWTLYPSPSHEAYYAMLADTASPQIAAITSDRGRITSVTSSPDGTVLATVSDSGTVQLWNAHTLRPIGGPFANTNDPAYAALFSPDGTTLAVVSDSGNNTEGGSVRLWDARTRQPIGSSFASGALGAAFSPDGTTLAITSIGTSTSGPFVQLWDVHSRQPIGGPLTDANGATDTVVFSPDGVVLAVVSTNGPVRLWNTRTRQPIGSPFATGNGGAIGAAFSPDGTMLAIVNGGGGFASGSVQVWDARTRQPIGSPFAAGNGGANEAAFVNSSTLITDDADGTVQLWNTARVTGLPIPFNGNNYPGHAAAAFSGNGEMLATVSGGISVNNHSTGTVQLWNAYTLRPIGAPFAAGGGGAFAAAFSPDGTMLATVSGSGTVQLWNTGTRQPIGSPLATSVSNLNPGALFSPDGTMLATISAGTAGTGTVQLWNAHTRQPIEGPFAGGNDGTETAAFSPDGTMLVTISGDNTVRLWNARTRQPIGGPITTSYRGVAFSPGSTMLAVVSPDGTVQLWNTRTRQPTGSPIATSVSNVNSVAFSPDGRILATGDGDNTVRLWDVANGKQIGSPLPTRFYSSSSVSSVAFSPDGKTLAAVSEFGHLLNKVQLWNVSYLVDPLARLCSQTGGSLTQDEWAHYVGSGPVYQNVCPPA